MVLTSKERPYEREDREVASDRFLHTICSSNFGCGALCVINAKRTNVKSTQRYPAPEHFFLYSYNATHQSPGKSRWNENQSRFNPGRLDAVVRGCFSCCFHGIKTSYALRC